METAADRDGPWGDGLIAGLRVIDRESTRYSSRIYEMRAANLRTRERMHVQDAPPSAIMKLCDGRFQQRGSSEGTHYRR